LRETLVLLLFTVLLVSPVHAAPTPFSIDTESVKTKTLVADIATVMKSKWKRSWGSKSNFDHYAQLFVQYGRKWHVDPLIVACVTYAESRFRVKPPRLMATRCKTKLVGCSRPGPCYRTRWVKTSKRVQINTAEAGMMQVLWYDRSTREGYQKCTGKKLFRGRHHRAQRRKLAQRRLSVPRVAVCVGTYELSRWRRWALWGGYGRIRCGRASKNTAYKCTNRMRPRKKRNIRFFAKYPSLKPHFWTVFYNWGSNTWKGNHYPRRVLYCYHQYRQAIRKLVAARAQKIGTQRAQIK